MKKVRFQFFVSFVFSCVSCFPSVRVHCAVVLLQHQSIFYQYFATEDTEKSRRNSSIISFRVPSVSSVAKAARENNLLNCTRLIAASTPEFRRSTASIRGSLGRCPVHVLGVVCECNLDSAARLEAGDRRERLETGNSSLRPTVSSLVQCSMPCNLHSTSSLFSRAA